MPLVKDYVGNDDDKKALDVIFTSTILARPYIAPPGIRRIGSRRYARPHGDHAGPGFLAETQKLQLNLDPTAGDDAAHRTRAMRRPSRDREARKALAD